MIPFLDLSAQYDAIGPEIEDAVIASLRSGAYVLGPAVTDFENRFAAWCGTKHAIAVSSGTAALHLASTVPSAPRAALSPLIRLGLEAMSTTEARVVRATSATSRWLTVSSTSWGWW